ncbi:uncharacterized protein LOC111035112 isoform X2 [Myzus persicae]|uniref:uncharacterized protein LOC111035112 isoform X2 n=1 Tax=Myzus persicae TaxID=13164 RepID=UPI000B933082|nr:uncharacterized protein LOC111035112 isoform X2 [Myzus persicae]
MCLETLADIVFLSIFAEIKGFQWRKNKEKKEAKLRKQRADKEIEMKGICKTLNDFYYQHALNRETTKFIHTPEGKGLKKRLLKKKPIRTESCGDSKDYNEFTIFVLKKSPPEMRQLQCDLIKPKIQSVSDKQCNSFEEYLIQFGLRVCYNFFKHIFSIGKKNERNSILKKLTKYLKNYIIRHEKVKDETIKKKDTSRIRGVIKYYYKILCKKIMPHYNLFFTFYKKYLKSKEGKGYKTPELTCDYFSRIPRENMNIED